MIGYKDIFKMAGILIVSFCAVFVCALFLNYNIDLSDVEIEVTKEAAALWPAGQTAPGTVKLKELYELENCPPQYQGMLVFYEALCSMARVVSAVSGGCLLLTSVVLLCFYIGHYIDTHKKQLGILKALGYSRSAIASQFAVFGFCVLAGTGAGYICAHLLMPKFYKVQNTEGCFPKIDVTFHPVLCMELVALPAVFFALLAVFYSSHRLKISALSLMRESVNVRVVKAKKETDLPFLTELKKSCVRQRRSLVFFITFAAFCFSSMMQMSCSMEELASVMMTVMIMAIGIVLASVSLLIATTSVVKENGKTITMMKVFGYDARECSRAVLGGYRPWAYLGFAVGTVYQYALLKITVTFLFADVENVPDYRFDVPALLGTLAAFILLYESVMFFYAKRMERISVKEIMLE